ncbi:hypothetical protein RB2501_08180 [Robiginitalea biformata HTCC2501]|uniref:Hydrolase n=2 Tax=Flavobacteriaceae TaxID=49546 RepID=A4CIV6_ROBBH|nr:hypothetical protein RB2501_08180 [Robiginitalea biformata HTCC2501]
MGAAMEPSFDSRYRKNLVQVPEIIREASGIRIFGQLLKSFLFSTDVALIRNTNANAIIAVYPFTAQPAISHALISAADKPILCGVGGGVTGGRRVVELALHAEFQGAIGVVLNKPVPDRVVAQVKRKVDIPVVVTVVSADEDFPARIRAGVDILNVSGAENTPAIIRKIRRFDPDIAIIGTGGKTEQTIRETLEAGANAISYTPPSTAELFKEVMQRYRAGG